MSNLSLYSEVPLEVLPHDLNAHQHCGSNLLQTNSGSLIDRYLEGELGIHVYLRTRNIVSNLEAREIVAVFENLPVGLEVAELKSHSVRNNDSQVAADNCSPNQMQFSMSVDSRPIVQDHQRSADIPLLTLVSSGSTSVKLYGFNQVPYLLRDDFLHAPHDLFEFTGIGSEDKFPLLFIGGRVLFELQNGGIVHTGVECASELIQQLSEFERKREKPIPLNCAENEPTVPVVVYLGLSSINVVCVESIPNLNEGLAVELRPRNTIPARLEW